MYYLIVQERISLPISFISFIKKKLGGSILPDKGRIGGHPGPLYYLLFFLFLVRKRKQANSSVSDITCLCKIKIQLVVLLIFMIFF